MTLHGYTSAEKARIRAGWQCPQCFGPWIETPFHNHHFECQDCGIQWHASDPQFQGSERS